MNKLLLTLFLTLACAWSSWAKMNNHTYPGGVAVISLNSTEQAEPKVFFKERRVLTVYEAGKWKAYVGIPLDQPPGQAEVQVEYPRQKTKVIPFKIHDKQYPVQKIYIKDKRKVSPLPEDVVRIKQESQLLERTFSNWQDNKNLGSVTLVQPVKGRFSGEFGLKRVINNKPRSQHKGVDIAAPTGTPVQAAREGNVTLVQNLFFTGNTVVLDHGQGWLTIYCHLDKVMVNQGDVVRKQETLGTVGQTGRATGPHLHFGMILNEARVDPSLFWKLNN